MPPKRPTQYNYCIFLTLHPYALYTDVFAVSLGHTISSHYNVDAISRLDYTAFNLSNAGVHFTKAICGF